MKRFEWMRLCLEPVMPPLYARVREELKKVAGSNGHRMDILDVGGRKSPYTIGVGANIHVTDLPRQSEVQKMLNLGTNEQIARQVMDRRSNVKWVLYDDMTSSSLKSGSFDCVVSVEVLEHVEKDG